MKYHPYESYNSYDYFIKLMNIYYHMVHSYDKFNS